MRQACRSFSAKRTVIAPGLLAVASAPGRPKAATADYAARKTQLTAMQSPAAMC